MKEYELIDSGDGKKWERFGSFILCRPCSQAVWSPSKRNEEDAFFSREKGARWQFTKKLPKEWEVELNQVIFKVSLTEFGHLGVFPEHASHFDFMRERLTEKDRVLNLFAYSGGSTLAAAKAGAEVCHVDAAKGMVDWARENAALNSLEKAPIRWIVDDAIKFLKREVKRGSFYEGILLDPPTFGRGAKGEVFKIEEMILPLLELCKAVLSKRPKFVIFTCHTPGFTPIVLSQLMQQVFKKESEAGEMVLEGDPNSIPSGSFARISYVD